MLKISTRRQRLVPTWLFCKIFYFKTVNFIYRHFSLLRSILRSTETKRILISPQETLDNNILKSFQCSPHKIYQERFDAVNLSDYDLIFPLSIEEAKFLSIQQRKGTKFLPLMAHLKTIELCDNKLAFNHFMSENGFAAYIPQLVDFSAPLPFIAKRIFGFSSEDVFIIDSESTREKYKNTVNSSDYFFQELVHGDKEYAQHIYFDGNKIIYSLNIMYWFAENTPIKIKNTPLSTTICNNKFLDLFSAIFKKLNFRGICCVNYKIVDDKPMILEINPRVGGSLREFLYCLADRL